jgi:hypothetical protein
MRTLTLLALTVLAALPLSAHDHCRDHRSVVVLEPCRPFPCGEARRWDDHWEHRAYPRRYRRDEGRICLYPLPRPLMPPFEGRLLLHLR